MYPPGGKTMTLDAKNQIVVKRVADTVFLLFFSDNFGDSVDNFRLNILFIRAATIRKKIPLLFVLKYRGV
jgi:hypothetical protein